MKLTPMTIKKFHSAPVDVTLWNGNFNKATVEVVNNKVKYVLEVEDTHPSLRQFSCVKEERVNLWVWGTANTGVLQNELLPDVAEVVDNMREAVKMSDEYAAEIYNRNLDAMIEFYKDFYPSRF